MLYLLAVPAGLAVALFLNQTVTGIRIYKSLFFFPFVISQVVVGLIFAWFYAPDFGLLSALIKTVTGESIAILADERYVTLGIIAAGLWPQIAYCMILYLTGLNNINPEQVEAARMDGAKGWSLLWNIVLPQFGPATFIAIVVTVIGALRSFDLVSIMTDGGPYGSSRVLSFYMYEQALSGIRLPHGLWCCDRGRSVHDHDGVHHAVHRAHADAGKERLMFPTPVQKAAPWVRHTYTIILPVALIVWLLPLIGVAVTSIRPSGDLAAGNYFGMPSHFAGFENYTAVFRDLADRLVHSQFLQGDDPDGDRRGRACLSLRLCVVGL